MCYNVYSGDIMKSLNITKVASSCIKCKDPKCIKKCSLGTKINEILKLVEDKHELEAAKLLFEGNPFPFVTGSLCDVYRKCYGNCIKNKLNDSVKYFLVESYLGNKYIDLLFNKKKGKKNLNVAIVGGGMTGLTVAIRLINEGITPTIYEAKSNLGGGIINSLPDFRYNKDNMKKVIDYVICNANVYYNKVLGDNLLMNELSNYDYVVIATGASLERKTLNLSITAVSLLEDKIKLSSIKNQNIVVIGGGNTTMDIARALCKNNNVSIVYRRNMANAPASITEIEDVRKENINIIELASPVKINTDINNNIKSITVEKMSLYDDGSSRLNFKGTSEYFDIDCDLVVEATGSICDYKYLKEECPTIFNDQGWIDANSNFMTNIHNLYVGGDLYYGPKDFCSAISSGERIVKDILSRKD